MTLRFAAAGLCLLLLPPLTGCRGDSAPAAATEPATRIAFQDVTDPSGLRFIHVNGATPAKYLIETMGGGVCVIDYDSDGFPDLYFVQSGLVPWIPPDPRLRSALYRNNRDGTFTDVTAAAGVGDEGTYGMGCAVADIDNDGDPDLYVTHFGPNSLFRNNGDGTFREVGRAAGVDDPGWGASAAFADYDADGTVDLFVANYLDFTREKHKRCGDAARRLTSYCHPDAYASVPNVLYRNNGDGTFTDTTRRAGLWNLRGKGLGAVWTDYDADGDPDLFVANDSVGNFLYRNNGDGTFADVTLLSGTGYSEEGRPEAGMGVDAGDADGDGRFDILVTNLSNEINELYRNNGDGTFTHASAASGLAEVSLLFVGWGTRFVDADNDADSDLVVTNGHVMDDIEAYSDSITYRQRDFLFENDGTGRYREVGAAAGDSFRRPEVGRGLAVLDFDRDGREDLVFGRLAGRARLLRNVGGEGNHFLTLRLRGTKSNRDGIGARVRAMVAGRPLVAERRAGGSYLSGSEGTIHLGLGAGSDPIPVEVRWPSGIRESFGPLPPDREALLTEGTGRPADGPGK